MNQKNSQTKEKIDAVERIKRIVIRCWEYMHRNTIFCLPVAWNISHLILPTGPFLNHAYW
ncbi:hypothetical protein [Desulfomicrobium salsuginis]